MQRLSSFLTGLSLIALSAAAATQAANAQDGGAPADGDQASAEPKIADDFHDLDDLIVSAPYLEELDFLAGVSVLAGEELVKNNHGQLGEVLTKLPGVSATSFAPGASRPVLRGFQGGRVAVLVDGISNIDVSSVSADHAVSIDPLSTSRIEVLRGPALLLFGGQAVGGAVNVISKRIPRDIPESPLHFDLLGGFATAADEFSISSSVDIPVADRFAIHFDGSYLDSGNLRSGGDVLSPELQAEQLDIVAEETEEGNLDEAAEAAELAALRGDIPNSAVETWSFSSGVSFIDDGGSLGFSFNIYDTNYGVPGRPGAVHAEEEGEEEEGEEEEGPVSIDLRQYRFDLHGSVNFGDGLFEKASLRVGYADYTHTEFEGDEVGTVFDSEAIEARAELVQAEKNGWSGASGVQFQIRDFVATGAEAFVPPYTSNQLGFFTLQEFDFGGLSIEGALRYERTNLSTRGAAGTAFDGFSDERDFNNVSGAAGISYKSGDLKIGANISRTGRAPTPEELFSNGPHIATQAFEIGDPTLNSERSWNGEIFARYDNDASSISATIFANRFSNFIYEVPTGDEEDELPVFQFFQNSARFWGFEVEGSTRLAKFGSNDIVIDGVADYVRASIRNGVGPAPRIPALRLLGGAELQSNNFDLRGEVEWTDDQGRFTEFETPTDGFTMVNASLTWRPWGKSKNIALLLLANNIFDVEARRAASFTKDFVPLAGRDVRVKIRISL